MLKMRKRNPTFPWIETVGLSEVRPVELMQDQAQCILADYVRHR